MIKAIIFDMGGTLLHFERPGSGSWRELETPGIRGIYRYLIAQSQPIAAREDEFVEVMFSRLAEGWDQSTGGHVSLRAHEWIARVVADHALTLDDAALAEAVRHYARPIRDGVHAASGAAATLAALRAQGLRVGLISNTIWPGELHLEDLAEAGLLQHLEHTIFSGDLVCCPHKTRQLGMIESSLKRAEHEGKSLHRRTDYQAIGTGRTG